MASKDLKDSQENIFPKSQTNKRMRDIFLTQEVPEGSRIFTGLSIRLLGMMRTMNNHPKQFETHIYISYY